MQNCSLPLSKGSRKWHSGQSGSIALNRSGHSNQSWECRSARAGDFWGHCHLHLESLPRWIIPTYIDINQKPRIVNFIYFREVNMAIYISKRWLLTYSLTVPNNKSSIRFRIKTTDTSMSSTRTQAPGLDMYSSRCHRQILGDANVDSNTTGVHVEQELHLYIYIYIYGNH